MTIFEEIKKNKKTIIKTALIVGGALYLNNKYKIIHRETYNEISKFVQTLKAMGYIEFVGDGHVRIVEGLRLPIL